MSVRVHGLPVFHICLVAPGRHAAQTAGAPALRCVTLNWSSPRHRGGAAPGILLSFRQMLRQMLDRAKHSGALAQRHIS